MNDNILYHGYTEPVERTADRKRRILAQDILEYVVPDAYPVRIREAAQEVTARREVMADYICHTKENGHCDYESLAALVADAADAEDELVQLLATWQADALMERTSAPLYLDKLEDPTWDEVK